MGTILCRLLVSVNNINPCLTDLIKYWDFYIGPYTFSDNLWLCFPFCLFTFPFLSHTLFMCYIIFSKCIHIWQRFINLLKDNGFARTANLDKWLQGQWLNASLCFSLNTYSNILVTYKIVCTLYMFTNALAPVTAT